MTKCGLAPSEARVPSFRLLLGAESLRAKKKSKQCATVANLSRHHLAALVL